MKLIANDLGCGFNRYRSFLWLLKTVKKWRRRYVNYAITQPFFELQTPDFAWKFIWTVPTNYEKKISQGRQNGASRG